MPTLKHLLAAIMALHYVVVVPPAQAQEGAQWSASPGVTSATLAAGKQHELFGSAAGFDGTNLVVVTHWRSRTDTKLAAAGLAVPEVLIRCLDAYDQKQSLTTGSCYYALD